MGKRKRIDKSSSVKLRLIAKRLGVTESKIVDFFRRRNVFANSESLLSKKEIELLKPVFAAKKHSNKHAQKRIKKKERSEKKHKKALDNQLDELKNRNTQKGRKPQVFDFKPEDHLSTKSSVWSVNKK